MNILDYIEKTERRYDYRIKALIPLDDAALDCIERVIMKYEPLDMGRPNKTIIQARPMDFPQMESAEVWMVDVGLGIPASAAILRQEIAKAFHANEEVGKLIRAGNVKLDDIFVVRGANDPLEAQGEDCEARCAQDEEADKKGLKRGALLSTTADMPEVPDIDPTKYYGDAYNGRLVSYLRKVAAEQAEARKVDAPAPLFRWMDMPKPEAVDGGTPPADNVSRGEALAPGLAPTGNFDTDTRRLARVYDGKGGKTVLATDLPGMRKDGGK